MPGMIWGKVLRSPHPHARIKSIDTVEGRSAARREGRGDGARTSSTSRSTSRSCSASRTCAGCAATSWRARRRCSPAIRSRRSPRPREAIAAEACELIEVDYEVLPCVDRDRGRDQARRADPARLHQVRGQAVQHRRHARAQDRRRRGGLRRGRRRHRAQLHHAARCIRAISSRMPAWSASLPTARPRSGAPARASSWSAP